MLGVLASPITNLDTITVPLMIVPALGAALLASFSSFGMTVFAGIGIAMIQAWIQYQGAQSWFPSGVLPAPGLVQALPFIIIVIAMFARGNSLPVRGAVTFRSYAFCGEAAESVTPHNSWISGDACHIVWFQLRLASIND